MRTTVDLDPYLLKRLRDEAHRRGVSLKKMLTAAISRGLEERAPARRTRYRVPTHDMGTPLRPIARAMSLAASLEDDEIVRKLAMRK